MNDFENKIGTTFLDYEGSYIYNSYHRYSHERILNKLIKKSSGQSIVDLGCAGGTYYNLLKNKDFEKIYGIDLSAERLEKARLKGYITYNTNAQNLPFENETIDMCVCIDMLVHVLKRSDRSNIFKEVSRILKPSGFFIFSIPSKKAYLFGDYGVTKKTIFSNQDGIINDYCCLIDFDEIKENTKAFSYKIKNIIASQYDLKLLKPLKRISGEYIHYGFTLPVLDKILGNKLLRKLGKAVFFKIQKF